MKTYKEKKRKEGKLGISIFENWDFISLHFKVTTQDTTAPSVLGMAWPLESKEGHKIKGMGLNTRAADVTTSISSPPVENRPFLLELA